MEAISAAAQASTLMRCWSRFEGLFRFYSPLMGGSNVMDMMEMPEEFEPEPPKRKAKNPDKK
jgi:hypothetical protein